MIINKLLQFIFVFIISVPVLSQDQNEQFWNAAKKNNVDVLKNLIENGIDVNVQTEYGVTALMHAAKAGNLEAVNLLLHNGADPNLQDFFYGASPFSWSISKITKPEIIIGMIEYGADLSNPNILTVLYSMEQYEVVKYILKKGASSIDQLTLTVVRNHDVAMMRTILEYTKLNNDILSSALLTATAANNQEMIDLLEKFGANLPEKKNLNNDELENYVGSYQNEHGQILKIGQNNYNLTIDNGSGDLYGLTYKEEHTFGFTGYLGVLLCFVEIEGHIASLKYIQGESITQFLKVEELNVKSINEQKIEIIDEVITIDNPIQWPSFRGNQASGVADNQYPPVLWNIEKNINLKWKTYIPGLSHASPIIWDDNLFIITAYGNDSTAEYRVGIYGDVEPADDMSHHIWKIYCLDKNTGMIQWEKKAYEGIPRVQRHTKATQANSTPATNGKYIVALFGSEGLVCYDLDGNEQWRKDLGILDAGWFFMEETQWGHSSSPIIYNDLVIVQCDRSKDSYIVAYNLKTGKEIWKTSRDAISSWGTPTIYFGEDHDEIVTNGTKYINSYHPKTGEELWRLSPNSEITVATPVVMNDLIYVTSGYRKIRPIYAIKPGGKGDISLPDSLNSGEYIQWRTKQGGTYMPTPIAYDGYFYTLSNSGLLTCYDAISGEKKYNEKIKGSKAFTASIVAADGKLFCASEEQGVFVIKAGPEYELITSNPINEICMATPAITDGMIFIRGQHHIFCIARTSN